VDFFFHSAKKILGPSPSFSRGLTYATVDITGKWFDVVINTPNAILDTLGYKRGYTMCIRNAEPLFGENEQFYYKVDDLSTVEVRFSKFVLVWTYSIMAILVQLLPVSLAKLWSLNDTLRICSDAGYLRSCLSCRKVSRLGCAKCHSRYCSTVRVSIFSTFSIRSYEYCDRNVSAPIGPNISLNVKPWAFSIAIIEQTGASGTSVFASPGLSQEME
jgi:hypothetical protein